MIRLMLVGLLLGLWTPAEAAIAYRSQTSAASITGFTDVVTEPAGVAAGDVLIACVQQADFNAFTTPAGWTTLYSGLAGDGSVTYWFGYIARGESVPDLTWTFTTSSYRNEVVFAFSGVNTSAPIHTSAQLAVTVSTGLPQAPAVTASVTNTWAVLCAWKNDIAPDWIAPTGYTIRGATDQDAVQADRAIAASGVETPPAFTSMGMMTNVSQWAASVLLAPAAGSGTGDLGLQGVGR
jgi:hypothetical protein